MRFAEHVEGRYDAFTEAARHHHVDESSVRCHVKKWKGTEIEDMLVSVAQLRLDKKLRIALTRVRLDGPHPPHMHSACTVASKSFVEV